MPILNYTTKIEAVRTVGELQQLLASHGCEKVTIDYRDRQPVALTFVARGPAGLLAFALPCNWEGVQKVLQKQRVESRYRSPEQAIRVAWRIIKVWVEAQLALIEAGQATTQEVFLPYAVTKSGSTLYQEIAAGNTQLLLTGGDQ